MDWIGEAVALATTVFGLWQRGKAKKAKKERDELAAQLDAIRTEAGTKAPWEQDHLSDEARLARSKKTTKQL